MSERVLDEFFTYLRELGRQLNTRDTYAKTIYRLETWLLQAPPPGLEPVDLLSATEDHLRAWRSALDVAESSVVTYAAAVRAFYRWAHRRGYISHDPSADLPLPPRRRGLPRPINEQDLELAVDNAPPRIRLCLILAAQQGMRAHEIASMTRDWILEHADPPVIVIRGKGDRERIVPLARTTWWELRAFGLPRRGWIIPRADGKFGPNQPRRISQMCNEYLHDIGIDATLHQVRHRFGTKAYRVSRDLRQVQDLMGHRHPSTTAGYTAYYNPDAEQTIDAIQLGSDRLRLVRDHRDHRERRTDLG